MTLASVIVLATGVVYLRSAPEGFPFSDLAVMEIYTLHAMRGLLKVGPYSLNLWHHPGPLCFYLLAPFYEIAGRRTIGLMAGVVTINLASVGAMGWIVARQSGRLAATVLVAVMSLYLLRTNDLVASVWNPHMIVIPMAALVVVSAAVASGDVAGLPVMIAIGSFVCQTHIAVVPTSAVVMGMALALAARGATPAACGRGGAAKLTFWLAVAGALGLLLWFPPIVEEILGRPGNMTKLWRYFFQEGHPGQRWPTAFAAWTDMTTALARPGLTVAWGGPYIAPASRVIAMPALAQVVLLIAVTRWAWMRDLRYLASLCLFSATASATAFWSIVRIIDEIDDHQIFWISALGALNCASLVAVAATALAPRCARVRLPGTLPLLRVVLALILAVHSVLALGRARAYARRQNEFNVPMKVVAAVAEHYMDREQVRRPLFRIVQPAWAGAAGVILQIYKHRRRIAVEPPWIPMFGDVLSPNGREDAEFQFADNPSQAMHSGRPGAQLIAHQEPVYLYRLR
jgi:hypothetical protein